MPGWPSSGGSGGGGAIYEDADPVTIEVADGESTTVPDGQTWIVKFEGGEDVMIDGVSVNKSTDCVVTAGASISNDAGGGGPSALVTGWSV